MSVDQRLNAIETRIDEARQASEAGEYSRALDTCRLAIDATEDVLTTAREEVPGRVADIEAGLEEIEQLHERIETSHDAYQDATTTCESIVEELDAAAEAIAADNPAEAITKLDEIPPELDDIAEVAEEHDLDEVVAQANDLRDRCRSLREQATEARERAPESDEIPTEPRLSLDYEQIIKGDPLGSGGNADVYHATVTTDDGELSIALKEPRMSGTLHTETVERLLDEAETWQQLDGYDHIVSVVDYGSEPLPWIAMEYMDAGHLGDRTGELDIDQALWTAIAVTKAVRHAHDRGVAHLDLKPSNILFRSVENAWEVPKVADWGLSKHLLEHSKSIEGMSPHYAAPEQFDADTYGAVDHVTDVYQLGAVFYELFTGHPPFEGKPFEVMNQIQNDTPTPPSEVADLPPELDEILLTALATEKSDRYEHVLYLRDALQKLAD